MKKVIIILAAAILSFSSCYQDSGENPKRIRTNNTSAKQSKSKIVAVVEYFSQNEFIEARQYTTNKLCQSHVSTWLNKADGNRCNLIMGTDTVFIGKRRDLNKVYIMFNE